MNKTTRFFVIYMTLVGYGNKLRMWNSNDRQRITDTGNAAKVRTCRCLTACVLENGKPADKKFLRQPIAVVQVRQRSC